MFFGFKFKLSFKTISESQDEGRLLPIRSELDLLLVNYWELVIEMST